LLGVYRASQSFLYALEIKEPKLMMIETTGILVHYTWMFSIPYLAGYSVAGMLGFMLVAQMIAGVLLSFVFVQVCRKTPSFTACDAWRRP